VTFSRWRDTGLRYDFSGHSIFHQRHGDGATALLLIHGFPTASWDFEAVWPALCKQFDHVLAPDLLGFGYSDKPARHRYSLIEQADLCEALLKNYCVDNVHILAHDYGVSVAQELLARHEGRDPGGRRLCSITFLNGGLFPEVHRPRLVQRLLRSPFGPLVARSISERRFGRSLSRVFGPRTQPSPIELHDYYALISTHNGQRVMPRLIRYLDERREHRERWVGAMVATRVPLRLIDGTSDPVSGAAMVARYAELIPDPDVVPLEGIGHYPHVEAPDRTLKAFAEFHRKRVKDETLTV
jgi:pimeloyl-ACP methyl ester carboxylesterase